MQEEIDAKKENTPARWVNLQIDQKTADMEQGYQISHAMRAQKTLKEAVLVSISGNLIIVEMFL